MEFHYHLLINPNAGSGNAGKVGQQVIELLKKNQFTFSYYLTEAPGQEREIAQQLAETVLMPWDETILVEPYPLLVIIGGDGTLHEVINQFYQMDLNIPVSYIPGGSGNDFARALGIVRTDPENAFWQIASTKSPQKINTLVYQEAIAGESGVVLNNVGIGLDATIVAATNASQSKKALNKYHLGSLSYLSFLIKALFTQKNFPSLIEINGQTLSFDRTFLCTTTNIPYFGGGIAIAPMADPRKPSIDLVVIEKPNLLAIIHLLSQVLRKKHTNNKHFRHFTSSKLRIVIATPENGQADGETMGKRPYDIQFSTREQLIWYH